MSEMAHMTYTNFYISTENTLTSMKSINLNAQILTESMDLSNEAQRKMGQQIEASMSYLNKISTTTENLSKTQTEVVESQSKLLEESKASRGILSQIQDSASTINVNTQESLQHQSILMDLQKDALGGISGLGEIVDQCLAKQREVLRVSEQLGQGHMAIINILDGLNNLVMFEFLDLKTFMFYFFYSTTRSVVSGSFSQLLMELSSFEMDIGNIHAKYLIIKRIRLIFSTFAILVVSISAWFYRDYERLNYQLLLQLGETNRTIITLLQAQQHPSLCNNLHNKKQPLETALDIDTDTH
eukprot:gene19483-23339_t